MTSGNATIIVHVKQYKKQDMTVWIKLMRLRIRTNDGLS